MNPAGRMLCATGSAGLQTRLAVWPLRIVEPSSVFCVDRRIVSGRDDCNLVLSGHAKAEVAYTPPMESPNRSTYNLQPSLTRWLEEALAAMPQRGRLTMKLPQELAFGFTEDRQTEKGNQDRVSIAYCLDPSHCGEPWLFAGICDGVGGEAKGDVAASIAMAEILSELCTSERRLPGQRVSDAILRAHDAVTERLRGSATTFAGVFVTARGSVTIGSVGDSRIYLLSQDEVQQLSQDDTLEDMLRRHTSKGNDDQVLEALQGLKQHWKDSLGQAIGGALLLEPQIQSWSTVIGNFGYLLCTDGVWKTVDQVLSRAVAGSGDRLDLARKLLSLTDALRANDNATAVVIPQIDSVIAWLRSNHSTAERGLVHIVLPTDTLVAPWDLFQKSPPPMGSRQTRFGSSPRTPEAPAQPKSKRKPKASKSSTKERNLEIQLSIKEDGRDDPTDTTGAVPKEQ